MSPSFRTTSSEMHEERERTREELLQEDKAFGLLDCASSQFRASEQYRDDHAYFFGQSPSRAFHCSDTVGGPLDILGRVDPEANITRIIRSEPWNSGEAYDTYGRPGSHAHIIRETARLLEESSKRTAHGKTLLVCNGAPRTGEETGCQNGHPFYTTRFPETELQIIAPAADFRSVRDKIEHLFWVDGEGDIWPKNCQYRSSYVANAGERNLETRGLLYPADTSIIHDPHPAEVAYADRNGNLRFYASEPEQWNEELLQTAIAPSKGWRKGSSIVKLRIGDKVKEVVLALGTHISLNKVPRKKKDLVLYQDHTRGDLHTLLWPWSKTSTAKERLENSAYTSFGRRYDIEGLPITIE